MRYAKPEVVLLGTAMGGVQSASSNKQIQLVQDHTNPVTFGTTSAYEADE